MRSQMLILSARWAKQHKTSPPPSEGRTERPSTARWVALLLTWAAHLLFLCSYPSEGRTGLTARCSWDPLPLLVDSLCVVFSFGDHSG